MKGLGPARPTARLRRAWALLAEGHEPPEIARALGISAEMVYELLLPLT